MKIQCLIALCFALFGFAAEASMSGSSSISCSGHLRGQYFYAYTYQYVYTVDGETLSQEQHQMQFQGVLSDEDFELTGFDGEHVIYESQNYRLAVPFSSDKSLFIKDLRRRVDSPSGARRAKWEVLCAR